MTAVWWARLLAECAGQGGAVERGLAHRATRVRSSGWASGQAEVAAQRVVLVLGAEHAAVLQLAGPPVDELVEPVRGQVRARG